MKKIYEIAKLLSPVVYFILLTGALIVYDNILEPLYIIPYYGMGFNDSLTVIFKIEFIFLLVPVLTILSIQFSINFYMAAFTLTKFIFKHIKKSQIRREKKNEKHSKDKVGETERI